MSINLCCKLLDFNFEDFTENEVSNYYRTSVYRNSYYWELKSKRNGISLLIGAPEFIFLNMQNIFAHIWSCISQVTY